jgi:hypothetical protein
MLETRMLFADNYLRRTSRANPMQPKHPGLTFKSCSAHFHNRQNQQGFAANCRKSFSLFYRIPDGSGDTGESVIASA